jgi:ABC-type glutathione transport system ATPase component
MADILAFEDVDIEHRGRSGARNRILHDVSFTMRPGEAFGLVGRVRLRQVHDRAGVHAALPAGHVVTRGRIVFQGRTCRIVRGRIARVRGNRAAMIYQDPMSSLNPVMTIGRN